jgi:serine O-acetyltransferase
MNQMTIPTAARPPALPALRAGGTVDPVWNELRSEAERAIAAEPGMSGLLWPSILARSGLVDAVCHRIANRLASDSLPADVIRDAFAEAIADDPSIAVAIDRDLRAVRDRDPACERYLEPVLHFKGFHAIQTHRLAHWLWRRGRTDFALFLQGLSAEVFQADIHPAAEIGAGIFLDHATGFVVGETAVIEDDVSILHEVTLGGSGLGRCVRHPKIRRGVLLGSGAKVLGDVEVGASSLVAAGSTVLEDVPPCSTVAGVPARIVGRGLCSEPGQQMEHKLSEAADAAYESFTYVI